MLTNQYKTLFIIIGLMLFKGLAKAKSLTAPRMQVLGLEVTHGNMGIQLVKLNETISRIFEVKCISKMLKIHARKSP